MQKNLIIERFGLKFHREKKEMQGYELVIQLGKPPALPEDNYCKEGPEIWGIQARAVRLCQ